MQHFIVEQRVQLIKNSQLVSMEHGQIAAHSRSTGHGGISPSSEHHM
jgi:hypothetical protein